MMTLRQRNKISCNISVTGCENRYFILWCYPDSNLGIIYILAGLIATAIMFPSIGASSVFSTLGIGSVAIGFAFKDILQNLLSGLLILFHQPYRIGDVIRIKELEGTNETTPAELVKNNKDLITKPQPFTFDKFSEVEKKKY